MAKKLDVHITDIVENITLKIFEEGEDSTTFTFEVEDENNQSKITFKMEEKVAAIIFEGLNNIFINAEDEDINCLENEETNQLNNFFNILKNNDKNNWME